MLLSVINVLFSSKLLLSHTGWFFSAYLGSIFESVECYSSHG